MAAKNLAKLAWLLSSAGAVVCLAQTDAGLAAPATPPPSGGIALSQASVFAFYSSQPFLSNSLSPTVKYGSLRGAGGAATLTWNHFAGRTNVSAGYTGSYFASSQAVDSTAFSHSLVFDMSRSQRRWTIGFSMNGQMSSSVQYLFNLFDLSALGQIASMPGTADEFTSALLTGSSTNPQINNLVNRSHTFDSPLRGLLFGDRVASAGAGAYARYSVSPRLSLRFNVSASKDLPLPSIPPEESSPQSHLLSQSTMGGASFGIGYSLSPRTQVGMNLNFSRTFSTILPEGYFATGNASIGRIMTPRWFLEGHAGAGTVFQLGDTAIIRQRRVSQPVLGGSLAFRAAAQTWMFVEDWTVGDVYGAGATSTITSTVTWRWNRPGSGWSVAAGAGHQQLRRAGGTDLTGEGINASVSRAITQQVSVRAEYGFQTNNGHVADLRLRQQGVRLSLAWRHGSLM